MFLFQYNYNLLDFEDILKIKKISKIKKINVLDFGCGNGSWDQKKINKAINSIYFYDKNKNLISSLKNKYNSKKIFFEFNKNRIFKKKINLIVLSSVIQYMSDRELHMIFSKIFKVYKNKKIYIFINDHPIKHRLVELFVLPFINLKKFMFSISLIFKIKYLMTKYYSHNIHSKKYIINNFIIKDMGFISDMKYLRGKFLLISKLK